MPPASNTPKANRPITAVVNQPHTVNGMRIKVMPAVRISSVVTMKFSALRTEARQKMAIEAIHKSWPMPAEVASASALNGG